MVAVFGNAVFDISGFADVVAVFGSAMFDISGLTSATRARGQDDVRSNKLPQTSKTEGLEWAHTPKTESLGAKSRAPDGSN